MKSSLILVFMAVLSPLTSQAQSAKEGCARNLITQSFYNGYEVTSSSRERVIVSACKEMFNAVLGLGASNGQAGTPIMRFYPFDGVKEQYLSYGNYSTGAHTVIQVGRLPKGPQQNSGILQGTLLLPASGHVDYESALRYARNDTYTIKMSVSLDAEGKQFPPSYGTGQTDLVKDKKSLGVITAQELAIPLYKGHVTRILYYRSGSAGPAGFFSGRVIDFIPAPDSL